jgi:hypothetical protein
MPLDSQQNNPSPIRTNADGRITNIDDIREHLGSYSIDELNEMRWVLREALKQSRWNLQSLDEDYRKHQINVGNILAWIQMARKINAEWRIAEVWDPEEVIASYMGQVSEVLEGSALRTLIVDDQERYTKELCTLGEEIMAEIQRHNN